MGAGETILIRPHIRDAYGNPVGVGTRTNGKSQLLIYVAMPTSASASGGGSGGSSGGAGGVVGSSAAGGGLVGDGGGAFSGGALQVHGHEGSSSSGQDHRRGGVLEPTSHLPPPPLHTSHKSGDKGVVVLEPSIVSRGELTTYQAKIVLAYTYPLTDLPIPTAFRYEAKYSPKILGPYHVHVLLDDTPVSGSPIHFDVLSRGSHNACIRLCARMHYIFKLLLKGLTQCMRSPMCMH